MQAMTKQATVRLPDETCDSLKSLAAKTGRTPAYYIREAVEEYHDDLEDVYLAEQVIEHIRKGEETIYTLVEVEIDLGLVD